MQVFDQGVRSIGKLAGCCVLLLLTACQTLQTTQPGMVGIDRKQSVSPLVDRGQLTQAAALQYRQTLQAASSKGALDRNPVMSRRVQRIANRLIPQTAVFRPDALQWKWEAHVLNSDEINAWCMPGGKIAVYSALIDKLKLDDDELAAVMGHEIAHALREHSLEQASQTANANLGLSVAGALLGIGNAGMDLAGLVYQVTFELPNSREHETEADRIGVELSARAGYDPRAAVSLWQKMATDDEEGAPLKILSTHPPSAERQVDLADYARRVMPLYEAARGRADK